MTPEYWARVEELFVEALDSGSEPAATMSLCIDDATLRQHVLALLTEHFNLEAEASQRHRSPAIFDVATCANGRFRSAVRIGSGSFGDVYKVDDTRRGETVALKVLRETSPLALLYFKNETRKVEPLRHCNHVHPHELIVDEGRWMFTMQYIEGVDFLHYVRDVPGTGAPALNERERRIDVVLPQLVSALTALHDLKLVHRDVKPSNVLVDSTGRVYLLDFGLVRDFDRDTPQKVTLAGTPEYMSPEQARGVSLTEASDWYAVGVMLYEALTGVLPFTGDLLEVLRQKEDREPTPPVALQPGISADLNRLCMGLLQPDPAQRMIAARSALEIRRTPDPFRSFDRKFMLVGRDNELEQLRDAFTRSTEGRPVIVHIHGTSGVGKTLLVREFLGQMKAADPSILVFAGRCYQSESVPFQGLDDLIDGIAEYLRHLPAAELNQILPRNFSLMVRMFPVLGHLRHTELRSALPLDSAELRARAFAALRELFGRLAGRDRVILAIDDLQWGALDTSAFLTELTESADAPPLLLILSYRSEDIEALTWLKRLHSAPDPARSFTEQRLLNLNCLSPLHTAQLARRLARKPEVMDEHVLQAVIHQSAGDPFLVHQMMAWLDDNGASAIAPGQFDVETALKSRLDLLSPPERLVLELIAVTGQPLALEVLLKRVPQSALFTARDRLQSQHLLRIRTAQGRDEMEVYHDRIRAAVLRFLPPGSLRLRHQELASALEEAGGADPEMLATHYHEAGDSARAAAHALLAAKHALQSLAFNKAAYFFRLSLDNTPESDSSRTSTLRDLGDALSNSGRCAEAGVAYLEAANGSTGLDRTRLLGVAANQYLRGGYIRPGRQLLRDVLRQSGIHSPSNRKLLLLLVAFLRLRIRLRGLDYRERPASDLSPLQLFRLELCAGAALGLSMIDPISSSEFSSRFALMALRAGEPYRAALALAGEATQLCHGGTLNGFINARRLLERAFAIATRLANPHARGFVALMSGVVSYLEGSWKRCCEECDAAVEIFRANCSGIFWELSTANTFSFVARSINGEWSENRRRLPFLMREAGVRGDLYASISLRILGCTYVLDLAAGQPDAADLQLERDLESWPTDQYDIQHANGLIGRIDVSLYREQPEIGWQYLIDHWPRLAYSGLLFVSTTFTFSHCARGRIAIAMAQQSAARSEPVHSFLDTARSSSRAILQRGPKWAEGLGHLLAAGVASFDEPHRVGLNLERAAVALEKYGLTPFRMAAVYRLAMLSTQPNAETLLNIANEWAARNEIARPERIFAGLAPGNWSH
jgi:hypothetical protein